MRRAAWKKEVKEDNYQKVSKYVIREVFVKLFKQPKNENF